MPEVIDERDLRIAQLLDEAYSVMRSGATLDLSSWRERYPDLADEVAELLDTLREFDTAASDWRGMVAAVDTIVVESADQGTEEPFEFLRPAEQPGELGRLEGYRVLELLGCGGMGVVFRAEDTRLQREVALKVMKPSMAVAKSSRDRFAREGQAAARIQHDHIVTIYQVGEDNGVPFLAMQLLEGISLDERLRREGILGTEEVIRIAREIAEGLAAAHAEGLIHRDIKPANIWLESRPVREGEPSGNRVKILDFGLARVARADALLTQAGAIVGTPAFMAPEQARGETLDARCDLFSLGCVMYRMAAGRLPFHASDAMATLMAVALESPPTPRSVNPAVPAALSDLIMQCLSKNREDRPASALALIEMMQAIAMDSATSALVTLPARPAFKSPTIMKVAAFIALTAILAVVAYAVFPPVRTLVDQGTMLALDRGEIVIETGEADVEVIIRQPRKADVVQVVEKHGKRVLVLPAMAGEVEVREWPSGDRAKTTALSVERGGRQTFLATALLAERVTPMVDEATLQVESESPFELSLELKDMKTNLVTKKSTAEGKREFAVPAADYEITLTPIVTPELAGKYSEEQLKHVVRRRARLEPGGRETVRFDLPAVVAKAIPLIPEGSLDNWMGDVGSWGNEQEHGDEIRAEARRGAPVGGIRLWTKSGHGDFEFSFQARLRDNNGTLQVGFRDGEADGRVTGYRLHVGNDWQIHDPNGKPLTKAIIDSGLLQKADANDHYHQVQIRCVGGKVTVRINGVAVHEETIADLPAEGRISFTLLGTGRVEARIRKVELRKLPGTSE